jgi:hypothetical protein
MTGLGSRVAALEAEEDPTARVIRWIGEQHAYRRFTDWASAKIDAGPHAPIDELVKEAVEAVGGRRATEAQVREVTQAVAFRMHLFFGIITTTLDELEREQYVHAALAAYATLMSATEPQRSGTIDTAELRDTALGRVSWLLGLDAARIHVQAIYLDAAEVLFPGDMEAWEDQLDETQRLAIRLMRLAELDGYPPVDGDRPLVEPAHLDASVARLLEPARIKTLDEMGQWDAAWRRVRRWVGSESLGEG